MYKLLLYSLKKTRAMKKVFRCVPPNSIGDYTRFFSNTFIEKHERFSSALNVYYDFLINYEPFFHLYQKYNVNKNDLVNICDLFQAWGFGIQGGGYLPIAVISFPRPLEYLLINKNILSNGDQDAIMNVMFSAIGLLTV